MGTSDDLANVATLWNSLITTGPSESFRAALSIWSRAESFGLCALSGFEKVETDHVRNKRSIGGLIP